VQQSFRDALNQIRLDAGACEFAIAGDVAQRRDLVWVRLDLEGDERWVREVPDRAACRATSEGGFYFVDDATVALCPASCGLLGTTAERKTEVFVECADEVPVSR
ncbi:MAG: hypothetical protein AAGA56_24645, partial [Myxococcota bacterium]